MLEANNLGLYCVQIIAIESYATMSWKLSRFLLNLLLNNASSRCKVVPFGNIIVACPNPSMILMGPDIVWTFALRNIKFVKYSLSRKIECVVPLSSKQTSSFISTILIFALVKKNI